MRILITGGTGYIGSHVAIDILKNQHDLCIIDNLSKIVDIRSFIEDYYDIELDSYIKGKSSKWDPGFNRLPKGPERNSCDRHQ